MKRARVLAVDDDVDLLDILGLTLSEHYDVTQASNGAEGLRACQSSIPDLIVCDYMMPVMDGRDFCRSLRQDILLRHIPFIMLTGKGDVTDRIGGIEAGVDDYIVKPFAADELMARIEMIMRRTNLSLDASPLTHLPGNTSIMEALQRSIESDTEFAVGYADLDNFKSYNDVYGFERGDDVIQETARILIRHVRETAGANSFIGHIGGDDFVFITTDGQADDICSEIIADFDSRISSFYSAEDYKNGYVLAKDRKGNDIKSGLLAISIGIISNTTQKITHVAQVAEIGAELKKFAKGLDRSICVRNHRKE